MGDQTLCKNSDMHDPLLWLLWISIFVILMMLSASVATLTAINCESVEKRMQSFAAGASMCFQNLLGYASGCLLPGIMMDLVFEVYLWTSGYKMTLAAQLGVGFAF